MERASKRCCCLLACASGSSSSSPARVVTDPKKVPQCSGSRNPIHVHPDNFRAPQLHLFAKRGRHEHHHLISSSQKDGKSSQLNWLPKLWQPASVSECQFCQFLDEVFHLTFPASPVSQQTNLPRITDASIPPCQVQFIIGSFRNAGNQFNTMRLMVSRM